MSLNPHSLLLEPEAVEYIEATSVPPLYLPDASCAGTRRT